MEEVLLSHPAMEYAIAFGVPDPLRCSTDIRAMVRLKSGYEASLETERELLYLCGQRLKEYEVPAKISFREDLPVMVMGKVDQKAVLAEIDEKIRSFMESGGGPPGEHS